MARKTKPARLFWRVLAVSLIAAYLGPKAPVIQDILEEWVFPSE